LDGDEIGRPGVLADVNEKHKRIPNLDSLLKIEPPD
jgi:hypothetical protein